MTHSLHRLQLGAVAGLAVLVAASAMGALGDPRASRFATYANPVDLPYRYQSGQVPYREAADPTMVRFAGRYWLFPSHSKGYWYGTDLLHWHFVLPTGYDVDSYAPTVMAMDGKLYLTTSESPKTIWVTDDPLQGVWRVAATEPMAISDPALFLDDDGRVYLYEGLSPVAPLNVYELDHKTLQPVAHVTIPSSRDTANRGWEVPGDRNEKVKEPSYIEGAWMNKYHGRYYLQYAAAGTEHRIYADGVLISDKPMGPFVYQSYNPFSVKPTGFATGAGHGSTFQAVDGRWWHIATMTISKRDLYERRLGLFPAQFTPAGALIANTYLGDYPHYIGGTRGLVGWMLLSRHKPVSVSSTLAGFPAANAVDEDLRTWWSAKSGDAGEWLQVDLGAPKRIEAVQVNFADQDSLGRGISSEVYNYVVEVSDDSRKWITVIDKTLSGCDAPHDYQVLRKAVRARYVRIRNLHSPDGGKFSIYDLRVFGIGNGVVPARVDGLSGQRDRNDTRRATITWTPARGAEFYIVRFGSRLGLLNQQYQIYDGATAVTISSLTKGVSYSVTVDAVNENGISHGTTVDRLQE